MASGLGLVGYESSEDEARSDSEESPKEHGNRNDTDSQPKDSTQRSQSTEAKSVLAASEETPTEASIAAKEDHSVPSPSVALGKRSTGGSSAPPPLPAPQDEPLPGPSLGPPGPPGVESAEEMTADPQSPYSATRSQLRNLTMPPIPSFSIPPSPPGSPPPQTSKKFEQFLELKQKGRHFNENLAKSSALRNPTLLQKLMGFAGISEEDQHVTTLPPEVAVPTKFPEWAYGDQLDKAQKAITKKREEEAVKKQRESLNFVKASESGTSSRSTTPGTAPRAGHSAAERVMAELDGKGQQPHVRVAERKGGRKSGATNRFGQR